MAIPSKPATGSISRATTATRAAQPRATAAEVVVEVVANGRSVDTAMAGALESAGLSARGGALVQELSFGVLRWYWRLQGYLQVLLRRPFKNKDRDIGALLLVGLYQLEFLRIPPHAAVSETVAACELLKKPWAKGLVNAVLRAYQRRAEELEAGLDETARLSHPQWLLEALRTAWPHEWRDIVAANNERAPMTLRVNRQRQSRQDYLQQLTNAGLSAGPHEQALSAVVLEKPVPVDRLPGFSEGRVSVQDVAAQWAAPLMDLAPGLRVLDACAAPGGKTAHMLELEPELAELVAVDVSTERCSRISATVSRLDLRVKVVNADAADTDAWWDGVPFDRILVDAPCSGSGVIRRHPDIKLLRRSSDLGPLAERQHRLLSVLFSLLGPGGRLLYASCSVLPGENQDQLTRLLQERPDADVLTVTVPGGVPQAVGTQLLPGTYRGDGFYYAAIARAATGP